MDSMPSIIDIVKYIAMAFVVSWLGLCLVIGVYDFFLTHEKKSPMLSQTYTALIIAVILAAVKFIF